jgi:hypothetical protein
VPELLMPHVMRQVKIIEENGDFAVRVLDAQATEQCNKPVMQFLTDAFDRHFITGKFNLSE